jgi:asparagine synthase (glutamine-hydrolysing)
LTRQIGDAFVELSHGGGSHLAVDEQRDLTVLVHGDIYEPLGPNPAKVILERYASGSTWDWKDLNASAAVLVLDGRNRKVLAVTDRVNSRKVYASMDPTGWWISSSLNIHPTQGLSIDPGGIGSLLTNLVMHNNLTPFREIKRLPRSSVHSFTHAACESTEYWQYEFTGENRNVNRLELRDALRELLREAVMRQAAMVEGRLFISMSGGYDSKSIAGFLTQMVDRERICAFTYHHGPFIGDVDAPAAELAARFLGIEHRTVELYGGDLMRVLSSNAMQGQGMKLCKETDFWHRVGPLMGEDVRNALFVGDNPWGMKQRRYEGQKADVLGLVDVYPTDGIEWFLAHLPLEAAQALRGEWQSNFQELVDRVPDYEDHRDAQSFMYLDQRVANFITLWRECFQMPYVRVLNPYLDNQVLDFARTLPAEMREGKAIYLEAIESAFPDLLHLPGSKGGFGLPTFAHEIREDRNRIEESLNRQPSRLDDLIPPRALLALIDSKAASVATGFDKLRALGKQVPKRMVMARRAVRAFKSRVQTASAHNVPWPEVVLQVLALRGFLALDRHSPTPAGSPVPTSKVGSIDDSGGDG